jgi:DNA-binding protein YbaB
MYASLSNMEEHDDAPTYEGRDPTETVLVTIDGSGTVTDVAMEPVWWDRIDPRRLGNAVLEAIAAASRARVLQWMDAKVEAHDRAAHKPGEPPSGPFEINPPASMISHVLTLLDKAAKAGDLPPPPAVTAESDGGHVTVTLHGKQVVDIEMEPDWLGMANHLEAASELRSALGAAYAMAAEQPVEELGPAAELRALTANPEQFVNTLFGIQR